MAEKFWILWCPTSYKPPTVKFSSEKQAEEAAQSMVSKYHAEFIVMESRAGYSDGKPKRTAYHAKPKKVVDPVIMKRNSQSVWDSYEGWKERGRQVRGGERSRAHRGTEALFYIKQTDPIEK